MTSATAKSLSSTPLRNHENLSRLCKEMKSWILYSPQTPTIDIASESPWSTSTATEIAAEEGSGQSPDQNGASAREPERPIPEAEDRVNSRTSHSKLLEGPENKSTEEPPAPAKGKVDIVLASTTVPETNDPQLPAVLEAAEHSSKSISAPASDIKSSSSEPPESPTPKPLGVIQAVIPCPSGLETKVCLGDEDWSISSNCPSVDTDKESMFGPTFPQVFPNRMDSDNADCVTLEGIYHDLEGDSVLHFHDPVTSWRVKYLTSPSVVVPLDKVSNLFNSRCDIDPDTGEFLPPVLHPDTLRAVTEGSCEDYRDILWRQNNMTTELYVMKELRSRENIATSLRMALDHEANRFDLSSESGQAWPKANCTVRPATQADFPAIVEIVNEYHKREGKSRDSKSQSMHAEDVARIWDECQVDNRPFIVVTPAQEDFLDRTKWPTHSETVYEEFARFMANRPKSTLSVVGFAFIQQSKLGLNACACPEDSYSGHLNLVIHPEHRHRLYGSALLDRILISISPLHTSVVEHGWNRNKNESDGIYEFPASRNLRQYTLLHVDTLEPHDKDVTSESRTHFLKKFSFEEVGRLENVSVTKDDQGLMQWQDLVIWARAITPTSNVISGW
ncbi:hypothetical protein E4U55_003510 [Claviceps digitariae]|nr:hypothetical protein E4U55_003510 [Claviceps digitariae]